MWPPKLKLKMFVCESQVFPCRSTFLGRKLISLMKGSSPHSTYMVAPWEFANISQGNKIFSVYVREAVIGRASVSRLLMMSRQPGGWERTQEEDHTLQWWTPHTAFPNRIFMTSCSKNLCGGQKTTSNFNPQVPFRLWFWDRVSLAQGSPEARLIVLQVTGIFLFLSL